jgi:hypothetical protein
MLVTDIVMPKLDGLQLAPGKVLPGSCDPRDGVSA